MGNVILDLLGRLDITPDSCAEVGVRFGNAFKSIVVRYPDIKYYGVDPYRHFPDEEYDYNASSNVGQNKQDEIYKGTKALFDSRGKTLIRKTSLDATNDVPNGLSYVFIDGNHSKNHVKADIIAWWSKLRAGGILIAHDYSDKIPGVIQAVRDVGIEGEEFRGCWYAIRKDINKEAETINVIGLARTGHHAVMEWMIRNKGKGVYFNNCLVNEYPRLAAKYSPEKDGFGKRKIEKNNPAYMEEYGSDSFKIYDYMNLNAQRFSAMFPKEKTFVVIRDAYNYVASCIKRKIHSERKMGIWKQHCKTNNAIIINYNRWCADLEYRNEICAEIGCENTINPDKESSIGASVFNDKNQRHDRWRSCVDDPAFWSLIDEETENINMEVFGFMVDRDTKELVSA